MQIVREHFSRNFSSEVPRLRNFYHSWNFSDFFRSETLCEAHPHSTHKSRFATSKDIINVGRHDARRLACTSHDIVQARIALGQTRGQTDFLVAATFRQEIFVKSVVKFRRRISEAVSRNAEFPRACAALWVPFWRSIYSYIAIEGVRL